MIKRTFTVTAIIFLLTINIFSACSTPKNIHAPSLTPAPAKISTVTPTPWVLPGSSGSNFRAIHMGGNWGTNQEGGVDELPPDYFEWLRDLNVNWVGITVSIYVDDSLDSTVERKYSKTSVGAPTFSDISLINLIRAFRQHGFNVYLTLAFDDSKSSKAKYPVYRWQLGDPDIYNQVDNILPENWPWALKHPNHESFVNEFWQTYNEQAVHFAEIAEQEGVGLYSLGTETDRLFRTQSGWVGSGDFADEIARMIQSVRKVYGGPITYDSYIYTLTHSDFFGTENFWEDTGLDVIGISAYFPLVDKKPASVMSVEEYELVWESLFERYLVPLKNKNPEKTILFTEFGYTDSLISSYTPNAEEGTRRIFNDSNRNGLDDGQEVQANIYKALFNVMDSHPGVLTGAFLWNNMMASDQMWNENYGKERGFDIRGKLSEDVVKDYYRKWREQP